jgi:hypothetical protein
MCRCSVGVGGEFPSGEAGNLAVTAAGILAEFGFDQRAFRRGVERKFVRMFQYF